MALGLGLLGLSPAHFWALTPKELEAAIAGRLGRSSTASALSRSDLSALMRRYPDDVSLPARAQHGFAMTGQRVGSPPSSSFRG